MKNPLEIASGPFSGKSQNLMPSRFFTGDTNKVGRLVAHYKHGPLKISGTMPYKTSLHGPDMQPLLSI